MGDITGTLHTCEAVISESCFILRRGGLVPDPVFTMIQTGVLAIVPAFHTTQAQQRVAHLVNTYHNLPASFADACLVRMAEATNQAQLFSLDRDFTDYRTSKGKSRSLISPY